jgi:G:T-mismatch repair DNA endonuclease (very short patch repair protein)
MKLTIKRGRKSKYSAKSCVIAFRVPAKSRDYWKQKFEKQLSRLQKAS